MWSLLKPLLARYLPVVARYIAVAVVGLLLAGLRHLNLQLDPQATAELTAGLAAVFLTLLGFALNGRKQQAATAAAAANSAAGDSSLASAVRQSAASGQEVATEDPATGQIHLISAKLAPKDLAK